VKHLRRPSFKEVKMQRLKRFILISILFLIFVSCENNVYEINTMVDAEIIGQTNECIGIHYEINDFEILEDICDLKMSQINYIMSNATNQSVNLRVFIRGSDFNGKASVKYYLGSEEIGCTQCFDVPMSELGKAAENHPDFKWTMIDGVEQSGITTSVEDKKETVVLVEKSEQEEDTNDIPTLKVK